jgi:cytidine deaminase
VNHDKPSATARDCYLGTAYMNDEFQPLIDAALAVRKNAYAPYSKFLVGAAVLTADGTMFIGTNVENASYGLTICAERIAAGAAVAAGHRTITAVAVATEAAASPCGACRQFLAEFGGGMKVFQVDAENPTHMTETSLDVLLPEQFDLER